ncbi:MAG: translin [Archaeoglobaceae archaeon]|nr:translin [Archaeoglobaceae archaeon]MDK2876238.1 translin [Archaeoglobaceae archaeon]
MMKIEDCRARLEELEKAREELLKISRELRILASKAIVAIHEGNLELAEERISKGKEILSRLNEFQRFPEIFYSLSFESMQEFAEAVFFEKAVKEDFDFTLDFEISHSAFITGLADAIGELRRFALSKMIENDLEKAEEILEVMERIYSELLSFVSFPEKLIPNLRQKLDVARAGIERTKSDLITAKLYASLDRNR